ncbi:hypothetical protein Tco_1407430 [Tanacetum coccineum]
MSKKNREKVVHYPRFLSLLLEYMMPEYDNEELTINPTQVFSVHNWALKPNQTEGPPFTDHMKAICNFDVPVDSKAPKPSSQTKEVPQSKKPRAKSGLRRKQSLKHTSESKTEASKSKTGQLEKETRSCSAKDKSPSHLSPSTPVVSEMHKEAHRAVGGPTSLGATSKEGAHPQLSSGMSAFNLIKPILFSFFHLHFESTLGHDVLADSTAEADPGLSAPNDSIPSQQDEPIIISDESEEEEEVAKDKESHASSHDNDELKQQKAKVEAEVASMKARLSYPDINQLTNLLVAELKNIQWELPAELQALPVLVSLVQKQLKTLDSLPSVLNKVTKTMNRFATVVVNASGATTKDVPSAGQATASPAEGEEHH